MKIRLIIALVGILVSTASVFAQPRLTRSYAYRHYTTRDGLPQIQVTRAFQDSDGYLWFATKYGVTKYDGISFKNYTPDDGFFVSDATNIFQAGDKIGFTSSHEIAFIHPDGTITAKLLPDDLRFQRIIVSGPTIIPLDDDHLLFTNAFYTPAKGDSHFYVFRYSISSNKVEKYNGVPLAEQCYSVSDNLMLTNRAVSRLDHMKMEYAEVAELPIEGEPIVNKEWSKFFIRKRNEVYAYDFKSLQWNLKGKFNHKGNFFPSVILQDGSLAYHEDRNLKMYPVKDSEITLSLPFVNQLFVDKENNLWVCSENGLYNFFNLNMEDVRLGLSDNDGVWTILQDNDKRMWFGSYGGGLWRSETNGVLVPVGKKELGERWKFQYMGGSRSKDGRLFFTFAGGIASYINGRIETSKNTDVSLFSYFDNDTETLYYGTVMLDGRRGLNVKRKGVTTFYGWDKGHIVSIVKDGNGKIRLGSFYGQGIFTGDTILVYTLRRDYQCLVSMSIDSTGRLWKGTERGVYVEMKDGTEYRVAPEMIKMEANSIYVYQNKYLLVGGLKSFFIIDIRNIENNKNPSIWEIGYDRGFIGFESGQNGFFEDADGQMWLTAASCMMKFDPEKLLHSFHEGIPPIRISRLLFSKDNASWQTTILPLKTKTANIGKIIELAASDKFLRFEFISNSISAPQSLRFRYRLKGFSNEWSLPTHDKTIEFTNIRPGKYTLEVQNSIDGSIWSAPVSSPVIQVNGPILLRWYMLALYLFLFLMLVVGLFWLYAKRLEKKKISQLAHQKLENELQLRNLHSKVMPHFTQNVLTAIANIAMEDNRKAGTYISLFSKITNLTLSNADKNYNSLANELEYIKHYLELEKMRFGDKIEYEIKLDEQVELDTLLPAMALHTYCDNAIRHGLVNKTGKGILSINIQKATDGICIEVSDNGIGRKRSEVIGTHGNGLGLKLIQQQLDFYNKMNKKPITQTINDLYDQSGRASGTKIELFLPEDYVFK